VFPGEHEFTALVMDCGPRRHLAAISLRGKSNSLESRIERVSGMYFLEKLAGRLGKRDEHVSDVLRKECCPGSRERKYLQTFSEAVFVLRFSDVSHFSASLVLRVSSLPPSGPACLSRAAS
jgi:hypothetical protein